MNDPTYVVSEQTQTNSPDQHDTPTQRAVITQLTVDELDAWLERIRERRLIAVKRLEAAARVKADDVRLTAFLKLETSVRAARNSLRRLDEQMVKVEKLVHKCRIQAMTAQLEVGSEDQDAA